MKPETPAPEFFASKAVVAKDSLSFLEHLLRIVIHAVVEGFLGRALGSDGGVSFDARWLGGRAGVDDGEQKNDGQDRRDSLHNGVPCTSPSSVEPASTICR